MVASKRNKVFYFCLFLLPALALYATFFIFPLIQGVTYYSFTDWNGIVPEIPLSMKKGEFEQGVLAQLQSEQDLAFIQRYYRLDATGQFYQLQSWIEADNQGEGTATRQLTDHERKEIKKILKKVGITPIKYIGLDNFREMWKDQRFLPRRVKRYLFSEFDALPLNLKAKDFQEKLLDHITDEDDQAFLLSLYTYNGKNKVYELTEEMSWEAEDRLRLLLSDYLYEYRWERGVIGFTLFFTFYNVLGSNLLALVLALILDTKLRFRNVLRSMFFLPNVISLIIVAYVWSFVFRLIFPALTGISVWLGSPDLAPYATLIVSIWQGCGYLMVIYLAGLQTIPGDLMEAAEVDGANWYQRLLRIRFPLLMPAFTICFFYSLANSLKTFDILWALNQGGPGYATTSIVIDIYKTAFMQNRYGYATAKAIVLCVAIIILTSIQLSLMKKREVEL